MKAVFVILLTVVLQGSLFGQTTPGKATTSGVCSPATSGNNNTFVIKCGIGSAQGKQMIQILNKVLANQIDPTAVMTKLDEILKAESKSSVEQSGIGNQQTVIQPGSLIQSSSGGVNVQQGTTAPNSPIIDSPITLGSVPKDISPQDMNSIITYLSSAPIKESIRVVEDQFSGSAPFPDKFYDALKSAGWTMLDAGVSSMVGFSAPGKKFQGAVVLVKGEPLKPDESFNPTASDPLNYIGAVLESQHIPRILRREPNLPEGQIIIQFEGGFPN